MLFILSHCSESDPAQDSGTVSAATTGVTSDAMGTTGSGGAGATPTSTNSTASSAGAVTTSAGGGTASTTNTTSPSTVATTSAGGSTTTGDSTATGMGGTTSGSTDSTVGAGGAGGTTMGAGGTAMTGGDFSLTSSELEEGGAFMDKHTCALNGFDNDESPPLAWSGAPAGTMSFAITFLDVTLTDMGDMNGYHYVIWDIPASVSELPGNLPTGATITDPVSAKQYNPLSASYLGPCPNIGGGSATHTYEFTIYAMPDAETASLAGLNNVQQLDAAIQAVAIGSAVLSGTSDAAP